MCESRKTEFSMYSSSKNSPLAVSPQRPVLSLTLRGYAFVALQFGVKTLKTMNSVQKNSQIRNFCTEFLHFARSAKITAFYMAKSHVFVFF